MRIRTRLLLALLAAGSLAACSDSTNPLSPPAPHATVEREGPPPQTSSGDGGAVLPDPEGKCPTGYFLAPDGLCRGILGGGGG